VIGKLEADYGKTFNLDAARLDTLLSGAAREFAAEAKALGLATGNGPFAQGLRALVREPEPAGAEAGGAPTMPGLAETVLATTPATMAAAPGAGPAPGENGRAIRREAVNQRGDANATGDGGATDASATGGLVLAGGTAVSGSGITTTRAAATQASGGNGGISLVAGGVASGGVAPGGPSAADAAALAGTTADPVARQNMLTAGIQDITNTLAGEYQLNDVLRIILETMYRAIGFTRVMFCTRDPKTNTLKGRFGFGAGADAIVKAGFQVPLAVSKDVFYAAISKSADICIEDRESEKIRAYIPEWYRQAVGARGFVIFPVMVNKKPVALIYADGDTPAKLRFGEGELNLLKTLRNQAILAIRQKSPG
jgi:hypothetical protein